VPGPKVGQDLKELRITAMSTHQQAQAYNYKVVRQFVVMTVVWGIVGMAMGVWIA